MTRALCVVFVLGVMSQFVFPDARLQAQTPTGGEEPRYPGTTGESVAYDTVGLRDARIRTAESAGLIEQPIDPEFYMVGPNDILSITIVSSRPTQFDVVVTPDAKVLLTGVGEVDVRGKTLTETKTAIGRRLNGLYKGQVSVSLRKMRTFKVYLIGAVIKPGVAAATPTSRVSEMIDLAGGATTVASKRNIDLIRNKKHISVDLQPFYSYGDLSANPTVEGGDVISIGVQDRRNIVAIYGAVHRQGEFGFKSTDSISSIIRYALGFTANALLDSVEVVSVDEHGDIAQRSYFRGMADGSIANDRPLKSGDRIFVRSIPKYLDMNRVVVAGEVKYPNSYAIERNKTKLREIIDKSGGFTANGSISDAVLIRRQVLSERDPELDVIAQIDPKERTKEQTEYFRVKSRERPGVMSVDFVKLMSGDEKENIVLVGEDSLYVPIRKAFVKISGKVKNPGNVTYERGKNYRDYIATAGGFGWRADESNTQVVKSKTSETFLASTESDYAIDAGDQIFVPEKPPSDFWAGFTTGLTVFAQLMTIVAVVYSITRPKN